MPVALDQMQQVKSATKDTSDPQPALHPSRIEKMVFIRYSPPPVNLHDRADYDMWLESINYLCDDLHWLMQQPHDKFWCQTIFDESLHIALDSFLRQCPRSQDLLMSLPESGKSKHLELCRLVFMTLLRMSTHKESKDHFLTPSVFGDILYENFLFDIPKLMDMCALFGKNNSQLLGKMVSNIFTQQPKYMDDLKETVSTIKQVLENIAFQCGVQLENSSLSPQKLEHEHEKPTLSSMKETELLDLMLYISDMAITLHRFFDIYPPACQVFHQAHFYSIIASFYEGVVPELTNTLKQRDISDNGQRKLLKALLSQIKKSLLSAFRLILSHNCFQPVLENSTDEGLVTLMIEDFLHTMTAVLNERQFLAAYEGLYSFQGDVDLLLQASSHVDASQFEYIQSAINVAFATFGHRKSPRGDTNTGGRTSPDGAPDSNTGGASSNSLSNRITSTTSSQHEWGGARPKTKTSNPMNCENSNSYPKNFELTASLPRPSDVEIESLISAVKDILPDLGDGFVECALEEFAWNSESVVSAVLENNLPSSLEAVSFDKPRQQRSVNQGDGQTDNSNLIDTRRNVFDNDEFDVFHSQKVDHSRIHKGKRVENIDLGDKSVIHAVKETYEAYGSIDQESMYDTSKMYDDEYDDTYDTNDVGADDADSADELTNKVILPRVLQDMERSKLKAESRLHRGNNGDDDEEEDEDDEQNFSRQKRDHFVEDPARLREIREQQRLSQASRGRRGRAGNVPPKTFDAGRPKGQGQTKEVQNNRKTKEKFKGQKHRLMSDKKMSKGMF